MYKSILKSFETAGIPLEFDGMSGYWYYNSRNDVSKHDLEMWVELYPSRNNDTGEPHVVGGCWVGGQEYMLNHPSDDWMNQHGDVAMLLAQGKAPF